MGGFDMPMFFPQLNCGGTGYSTTENKLKCNF